MKQKLINLGYVLVVLGLVLGGVHNILSSHPVLSQSYNKLWQTEDQAISQLETQTDQTEFEEDFLQEENLSQSVPQQTQTESETEIHVHTWREDFEFIWVGNGDGTGHVEEKVIVGCECGAAWE